MSSASWTKTLSWKGSCPVEVHTLESGPSRGLYRERRPRIAPLYFSHCNSVPSDYVHTVHHMFSQQPLLVMTTITCNILPIDNGMCIILALSCIFLWAILHIICKDVVPVIIVTPPWTTMSHTCIDTLHCIINHHCVTHMYLANNSGYAWCHLIAVAHST